MSSEGFDAVLLAEDGDASGVGAQTWDADSKIWPFDSETMQKTQVINNSQGLKGTRHHHWNLTSEGNYTVGGTVTMRPGRLCLDWFLPHILGTAAAGTTFAVADTLLPFSLLIDKGYGLGDGGLFGHEYIDCVVSRATFSASAGQPLVMALDIVGKTADRVKAWPQEAAVRTLPTFNPDVSDRPIEMNEGVLTLWSASRQFESFELVIDNFVTPKFRNSKTAVSLDPSDRVVTLRADLDHTTAMQTAVTEKGATGAAGSLVFTSADGMATTFTFAKLIAMPDQDPTVGGKGDVLRPVTFQAFGTDDMASNDEHEIVVTNDSTET